MKQLILILLFSTFYACQAQGVKGNKQPVEKEYTVSNDFSKISASGAFNVIIDYGSTSGSIIVNADSNLHEYINIEVEDNQLYIGLQKNANVRSFKKLEVRVTARDLQGLLLRGSGTISQHEANDVEEFMVYLSGSGDIITKAKTKVVDIKLSGSGDIEVAGETDDLTASLSGSGDIVTKDLKANTASVSVAGSGDITTFAIESIKATVSGSGDIEIFGNPKHIDQKVNGSGDITKK